MTYPALIRESLTASRTLGLPFPAAWTRALADHPVPPETVTGTGWHRVLGFMEHHMRAAYEGRSGRAGTYRCPDPEVSALGLREPQDAPQRTHCRWGDGCTRIARHGKLGEWWCKEHADVLERIAAMPNPAISPSENKRLTRGRERAAAARWAA